MARQSGAPPAAQAGDDGHRMGGAGVRKAVFPAAGLGTRMLPATKAQPKEMLTVVDKPVIQYGVEEAVASGLTQMILVTAANKGSIEDHFDLAPELERLLEGKGDAESLVEVRRVAELAQTCYVRQKRALGLGHAVLMAKELVGDEPFAVFLPDDIMEGGATPCMAQLLEIYRRLRCSVIAAERVPPQDVSRYGILSVRQVEPRLYQVLDLVEKPKVDEAPSNLAIMGRYLLTPDIFPMLEQTGAGAGGEIQLTDGLKRLLQRQPIYAYEYDGRRHDCGTKLGYLCATVELALKRPDLGANFRRFLQEVLEADAAVVGERTGTAAVPATLTR